MSERMRQMVVTATAVLALGACGGLALSAGWSTEPPSSTAPQPALAPGQRVPDLDVEWFDGTTRSLESYAGTPLIVNFWASWCAPCVEEMPDLERIHQLADGEFAVIGINTQDAPERAAALVRETGVTYELVRDPDAELSRAFGVRGLPATFYVDGTGRIVAGRTGIVTFDAIVEGLRESLGVELRAEG